MEYYEQYLRCVHTCKQSFRITGLLCKKYQEAKYQRGVSSEMVVRFFVSLLLNSNDESLLWVFFFDILISKRVLKKMSCNYFDRN